MASYYDHRQGVVPRPTIVHDKQGVESGHNQVSNEFGERIITSFMRHPDGSVDRRTDLYFAQTTDMRETWQTVDGQPLELPLTDPECQSRVRNYESEGRLVYINDIQLDAQGHPVIFFVTAALNQPGPPGEPFALSAAVLGLAIVIEKG